MNAAYASRDSNKLIWWIMSGAMGVLIAIGGYAYADISSRLTKVSDRQASDEVKLASKEATQEAIKENLVYLRNKVDEIDNRLREGKGYGNR